MTPRHFLDLNGAEIIKTRAFSLVQRAVSELSQRLAMGVVHGLAGLGKSFAVSYALERSGLESHVFTFPRRATPKWLTCDLLERLTGVEPKGEHRVLRKVLLRELAAKPRIIAIDEAQELNKECVDHLRGLHDDPQTSFVLLLVGGNGCWELLSRYPMLRSRVWRRVTFEPLPTQEMLTILPSYHAVYCDADPEVLVFIDDYWGHGNFRDWAGFTASAVELCRTHDLPTISEEIARTVFAMHGGGVDVA